MQKRCAPGIVPFGADQTMYLVVDSFGANGSGVREIEVERADVETIISDMITGQFNNPMSVIAFNTLEHWAKNVSNGIAAEIQARFDMEGAKIPEHILDFVESYVGARDI